jgi:hypothetical protein
MNNKTREWISVIMCGMLQSCLLGIDLVLHGRGFMHRTTYKAVLEAYVCVYIYIVESSFYFNY